MVPLHRDPHFTFRFAEPRLVDRFHLDGIAPGTAVSVFALDAAGGRGELLAQATSGDGGWVTLAVPLVVSADRGFVAVV